MADAANDPAWVDGYNPSTGVLARTFQMLNGAQNGSGNWVDTRGMRNATFYVYGTLGGGSVQLMASNDANPAGTGDAGVNVGAALSSVGFVTVTGPYRWMKAVVTGSTGASIKGVLHGAY